MKKTFLIPLLALSILSCKKQVTTEETQKENASLYVPYTSTMAENAVIYEANIRQYSDEGTLAAFTQDLPKLKELGVKIIWLMPVHPIGVENRKQGLGSYYSIQDYRAINPEFGTHEDFRKLVGSAHDLGMYVIMDWVANHTAWDHSWVKNNPEYYAKDKDGKMISPYDWSDVVKLDYKNPEVHKAMMDEMAFWIDEYNIDGFRCDVAYEVPTDFWETTTETLNKKKELFWLAEAEEPALFKNAFDMVYGWESHHLMNAIAKGEKNVEDWDQYIAKRGERFEADDFTMMFTSNHDENSWQGSEYERMGDAAETFAALTYLAPSMPLIYSGQEYDFDKRLAFFEKDVITKEKGKMYEVYKKLGALKNNNTALHGGKNPASYTRINTNDDKKILAFSRTKENQTVIFIGNLSKDNTKVIINLDGTYTDYMSSSEFKLADDKTLDLKPWEYKILLKK